MDNRDQWFTGKTEKEALRIVREEKTVTIESIASLYSGYTTGMDCVRKLIRFGVVRLHPRRSGVIIYINEELPKFDEGKK